jgi:PIN domain nuclease of toxin-antitoxin system
VLNLDTHILVHALTGDLEPHEARLLRTRRWGISCIVLWELAMLARLRRIALAMDDPDVMRVLGSVHLWPLTLEVVRAISELDFEGDPADEIIAATSLVHRVPLLTRDRRLLASKRIPLAG